ncbi:MAG TPA: large conductance mechanosensitive channel protein MscL [Thermoanaerobaculia bacterium]|nr:large conductance mechanosensitive channel protein MscL [Thermoanaerobaculia bacterium]
MISEFSGFLTKTNALALAVGVIIGAAVGKIVSSLSDDILMPILGLFLPAGGWRQAKIDFFGSPILYGHFIGAVVDFLIVSLVLFLIVRKLVKPAPAAPTKSCAECLEIIPAGARRCRACTANV